MLKTKYRPKPSKSPWSRWIPNLYKRTDKDIRDFNDFHCESIGRAQMAALKHGMAGMEKFPK